MMEGLVPGLGQALSHFCQAAFAWAIASLADALASSLEAPSFKHLLQTWWYDLLLCSLHVEPVIALGFFWRGG